MPLVTPKASQRFQGSAELEVILVSLLAVHLLSIPQSLGTSHALERSKQNILYPLTDPAARMKNSPIC